MPGLWSQMGRVSSGPYSAICVCGIDKLAITGQRHCSVCHVLKTLTQFFRHPGSPDGRRSQCKECYSKRVQQYLEADPEHARALRRARRAKNPAYEEWSKSWTRKHPDQWRLIHRCNVRVQNAIKAGKLVRPETCGECGKSGVVIEAAHSDYSQPLQVRWLCRPCHRRWDRVQPKAVGHCHAEVCSECGKPVGPLA